jgi:hypothetical protein
LANAHGDTRLPAGRPNGPAGQLILRAWVSRGEGHSTGGRPLQRTAPRWLDADAPRRFPVLFVQAMDQAHGTVHLLLRRCCNQDHCGPRTRTMRNNPRNTHGSVLYNPLQRTTGRDKRAATGGAAPADPHASSRHCELEARRNLFGPGWLGPVTLAIPSAIGSGVRCR